MKKTQLIIYQNDPSQNYTSLLTTSGKISDWKKISLTGRVWMDIFDYNLQVGDMVMYGNQEFVVENISTPSKFNGREISDVTISRDYQGTEEPMSHSDASQLYRDIKKEEYERLNPPNPPKPPKETECPDVVIEPSHYILYMHQDGGCDYTIGCGTQMECIDAGNNSAAVKKAKSILKDYGDKVENAILYEVGWSKVLR